MIAIIGTSDQPCWLAEACKTLLLLQHSAIQYQLLHQYDPFQELSAIRYAGSTDLP